MTNGRASREVSRKGEEVRGDGWWTALRRMERGGMVGKGTTGGGGTRVSMRRGRRFSFPLTLLLVLVNAAADFFHASADMSLPSLSRGELSSTRERPLVEAKVKAVDADAGRRLPIDAGSRAGGAGGGAASTGSRFSPMSWCCVGKVVVVRPCPSCPLKTKRSCLISADEDGGGMRYCNTLPLPSTLFFDSGLGVVPVLLTNDDASLCSGDHDDGAGPIDHGILDGGGPATVRRGPNSGIRRL